MKQLQLKLLGSLSKIVVGVGAYQSIRTHLDRVGLTGSMMIVSQSRILDAVGVDSLPDAHVETIPSGESAKSLRTVSRLIDRMVSRRMFESNSARSSYAVVPFRRRFCSDAAV